VVAGLCYGAIGTDTGGSIRLPSALCGITGLKPSYGLVSVRGIVPLSWSLDHAGPMTRTVTDAALMLQAIAHYDPRDIYCQKFPPVFYPSALEEKCSSLRLAVPAEFWVDLNGEVETATRKALNDMKAMTAGVQEISLSTADDNTVFLCESFTYHQKYLPAHEREYDPETLRRIRSGAEITAAQYVEAYRDLLRKRREVTELFENVDLIITPTTPLLAPTFSELEAAPDQLRHKELALLRNTRPFNTLGLPTISVPCGFSRSGLPIGLQIAGAPGAEGTVMALARAYQQQNDWHKKRPSSYKPAR
jgi:aspartyl-tRNA(Asn)/glutamyl-tRNA(Gln) amidotransferase subunit A